MGLNGRSQACQLMSDADRCLCSSSALSYVIPQTTTWVDKRSFDAASPELVSSFQVSDNSSTDILGNCRKHIVRFGLQRWATFKSQLQVVLHTFLFDLPLLSSTRHQLMLWNHGHGAHAFCSMLSLIFTHSGMAYFSLLEWPTAYWETGALAVSQTKTNSSLNLADWNSVRLHTCDRSSCHSCTSAPTCEETAQWFLRADAEPGGASTLTTTPKHTCSLLESFDGYNMYKLHCTTVKMQIRQ